MNTPLEALERLKELATLWDATGQEKWALGGSGYLVTVEDEPAPVADLLANPDEDNWQAGPTINMAMARGRFAVAAITAMPDLRSLLTSYEAQGERLREVEGVFGRAVEINAYSASDPLALRLAFENEDDRLAAANAFDALTQPPAMENGE